MNGNGYKYGGSKNTGALGWLVQRITAVLLVLLLLAHFVVIHYAGPSGKDLNFNVVTARLTHHIWGPVWRTITLLLLYTALFHGLNGVWGVLLDYIKKGSVRLWLFSLVVTIGLVLATLGSITILSFRPPPPDQVPAQIEVHRQGGGQ